MSASLHLVTNTIPGHGPSESGNLPCSGVYGRAVGMAARLPGANKRLLLAKGVSLKCSSGKMSILCRASNSNNQRRNPRQNRQGYSQNKNRQNDDRDYPDHLEEPDYLTSKNGPLLSFANSSKNQATAGPGPREREIVELFRKVQAQLRERTSGKEEKKFEVSKGQNKGNETVDSLLNLLRKHSGDQGKKKVNGGGAGGIEVSFDQPGQVGTFDEDNTRSSFNPVNSIRDQPQEDNISPLSRPPSNFRRVSPIPKVRYEPIISGKEIVNPVSPFDSVEERSKTELEAEFEEEPEFHLEPEIEAELEHDSFGDKDVVAGETLVVDNETSATQVAAGDEEEVDEDEDDEEGERKPAAEHENLDAMKLQDLRALAKTRGIKRYSKLKKAELIGLLSEDTF